MRSGFFGKALRKGKGKPRKGRLLQEYIYVLLCVAVLLALSFLVTSYILRDAALDQARNSVEVIFQQAEDRVTILEEDISNLYENVIQNDSVAAFFEKGEFPERWDHLEGYRQIVGNNMRINENLRNISLYDADGQLIASKGDIFFFREEIYLFGLHSEPVHRAALFSGGNAGLRDGWRKRL